MQGDAPRTVVVRGGSALRRRTEGREGTRRAALPWSLVPFQREPPGGHQAVYSSLLGVIEKGLLSVITPEVAAPLTAAFTVAGVAVLKRSRYSAATPATCGA